MNGGLESKTKPIVKIKRMVKGGLLLLQNQTMKRMLFKPLLVLFLAIWQQHKKAKHS
ncbi:hypothetical protein KSP39_PZI020097 [Platanthera zijinensis]|uniref:Uncharacterized protein n=1 Tax=Platanthera zijinensis TaxID=2320716 RepID=A0AAP0B0H6_9ASPA